MAEPRRDLPERTFQFALRVVKLCQTLDRKRGAARLLSRQLLRAATSVGANIEEGQASQSEADYLTKCSIACKEAREAHYWLRLLTEMDVISRGRLGELTGECNQLVAILTTIARRLKEKRRA